MAVTIIKYKDMIEEHREKFAEDWDKDSKNYDEELEENQLILIDVNDLEKYTGKKETSMCCNVELEQHAQGFTSDDVPYKIQSCTKCGKDQSRK